MPTRTAHRIGVNYKQIPVNRPHAPVHSYSKDGAMRVENASDPVYAPNSKGGPKADPGTLSAGGGVGGQRRIHPFRLH